MVSCYFWRIGSGHLKYTMICNLVCIVNKWDSGVFLGDDISQVTRHCRCSQQSVTILILIIFAQKQKYWQVK